MKKILVILILLMVLHPLDGKSQLSSDGKDFYVGLLYPSFMSQNVAYFHGNIQSFYGVYILISSYYDNTVTISYFDDTGKEVFPKTYNVAARRSIQVRLDDTRMKMTDPGEIPEYKACHITAEKAINVQYFSTGACAGGSYLALPTAALGKSYVVESYHDNAGGVGGVNSNENSAGYFMIIAAYDNTKIQIIPNTTTTKGKPGVNSGPGSNGSQQPFNISLNRGQCYMVKSTGSDISNDISGSTIESTKPVAVIGGHENAFTDGSDVGNIVLEARDYMVEQMIPCEYWDTTGYVSIPFIDSKQPAPGGEGDEYHVFACGPKANVVMNNAIQVGVVFATSQYPSSVASKVDITVPVNLYSTNAGGKFHVMMYDQRMQGSGAPFPAPSMMSIVPISLWKTSYLWYVPNNTFEILQGYYINVICRKVDYNNDSILVAVNGGKLYPIRAAGLSLKKLWGNIPDHPELVGITYAIGPGTYYATSIAKGDDNKSNTGFMIYNYGFRGIDPDRDLGDFCGDDVFFSYALPIGLNGSIRGDDTKITVTVDTLCGKWNVCAHTRGKNSPGIKQMLILDDPNGDIIRPGRKYYNTQFDPAIDPKDKREINLTGNDSDFCVEVRVKNPLDTAYSPLYIIDNTGNAYLVELRFKGSKLKATIAPSVFYNGFDSIKYPVTAVGNQSCATIYYVNKGQASIGDLNIVVNNVSLKKNNGAFTITNITPSIPTILKPITTVNPGGDTIAITVCFNSKDTALNVDTLLLENDCFKSPLTLVGQGGTGLIYATDHDFGSVIIGESKCDTVSVKNIGNLPFLLTKDWILHNTTEFSIEPSSDSRLPILLYSGGSIQLRFCFSPTASGFLSTTVDWATDIKPPYNNQTKSKSVLNGKAIVSGIFWDRPAAKIYADSTKPPVSGVKRVYLLNRVVAKTYVNKVYFVGSNASEFSVSANQAGYNPFERFDMQPNDSIWVDISFNPDMTKPEPDRGATRQAKLIANFNRNQAGTVTDSTVIDILGLFDSSMLAVRPINSQSVTTIKAYQLDHNLIIETQEGFAGKIACELYDLLGRKVYDWKLEQVGAKLVLPLPKISAGSYILRFDTGEKAVSCKVLISGKD